MKKIWLLYLLAACSCLLASLWSAGFRINTSNSMPKGIYRISLQVIQPGDLATFCLSPPWEEMALARGYTPGGSCPGGSRPLLKRIAGVSGDFVEITSAGISINGKIQDHSVIQAADGKGLVLESVLQPGAIPDGYALALGSMPLSFDGRYFGLVPQSSLKRVETMLNF